MCIYKIKCLVVYLWLEEASCCSCWNESAAFLYAEMKMQFIYFNVCKGNYYLIRDEIKVV